MIDNSALKPTPHDLRLIAVHAGCHPRTVLKALQGESHSTTTRRVEAALLELGLKSWLNKPVL